MTADHLRRVEDLYHAALQRSLEDAAEKYDSREP